MDARFLHSLTRRSALVGDHWAWAILVYCICNILWVGTAYSQTTNLSTESCPVTSDPQIFHGQDLASATLLGTNFQNDALILDTQSADDFITIPIVLPDEVRQGIRFIQAADVNGDGWEDIIAVGRDEKFIRVLQNRTQDNAIDWNSSGVREPKFVLVKTIYIPPSTQPEWSSLAVADFTGDGRADIFLARAYDGASHHSATLWTNTGNNANGDPDFDAGHEALLPTSLPTLGTLQTNSTNIVVRDVNGDRKLDILLGATDADTSGAVRLLLNQCDTIGQQTTTLTPNSPLLPCQDHPTFLPSGDWISDLGLPTPAAEHPTIAEADINNDGYPDLITNGFGASAAYGLRIYFSGQTGIAQTPGATINFTGFAIAVLATDLTNDGLPDLLVATDNTLAPGQGGKTLLYKNTGVAPYFDDTPEVLTSPLQPTADWDGLITLDYDHDPNNTNDIVLLEEQELYLLVNGSSSQFLSCGAAESTPLDLSAVSGKEIVVTSARMSIDADITGGTVTMYASNEPPTGDPNNSPTNWIAASPCADNPLDYCVAFPAQAQSSVRWKAELCRGDDALSTPSLSSVTVRYDYTTASEHFRAGIVVSDGVVYAGGFRQPGNRGKLFALNTALNQTYWEAGERIDGMQDADRNIFTMDDTGSRLGFSTTDASNTKLQQLLQATSADQAEDLIAWVRKKRFGIGTTEADLSRLGGIEKSTPAVIPAPGLPQWYIYAPFEQREKVDEFVRLHAGRKTITMFGARDGMIHALHSNTLAIEDPINGTEAWAFVPPTVATAMMTDYATNLANASASSGMPITQITAFPDGAPTVADVYLGDRFATVAVVGDGRGGNGFTALDITQTIEEDGDVLGPSPLWATTPGGNTAGRALAKPAIAHVTLDGQPTDIAILGTGSADDSIPANLGRQVHAVRIDNGQTLWKFQTACPVTSDITVFETDDDAEPGAPILDGNDDRAVFADNCGYVYKVEIAKDLNGGWNDNTDLGSFEVGQVDGVPQHALFSSLLTPDALGQERPIAGTIGARVDGTSRLVLFFGTGGLATQDVAQSNEFYAIYADTGAIRSKLIGNCQNGRCEKFYGGLVVTGDKVIVTRTTDPEIGTGTCDAGSSTIDVFELNADGNGQFVAEITRIINSAITGSLFGDAGAVYFATEAGSVGRIGRPRTLEAGGDTRSGRLGTGQYSGFGEGRQYGIDGKLMMRSWNLLF